MRKTFNWLAFLFSRVLSNNAQGGFSRDNTHGNKDDIGYRECEEINKGNGDKTKSICTSNFIDHAVSNMSIY